jgi:hypothetical protein
VPPKSQQETGTEVQLARLWPDIQKPFWALDKQATELGGAVAYGKFIRYRWPNGLFVRAEIRKTFIRWSLRLPGNADTFDLVADMRAPADIERLLQAVRDHRPRRNESER